MIKKGSDIEVILNNHYAATTAGSNGAINVWTDDDWAIRCEVQRYQRTLESKTYTNVKSAIKWVDKWLPKIK